MLRRLRAAVIGLILAHSVAFSQNRAHARSEHWVATWATAQILARPIVQPFGRGGPPPQGRGGFPRGASGRQGWRGRGNRPDGPIPPALSDQTIRMIVRTSLGGHRVRVQISNSFDANAVTVGSAHLAIRAKDSEIVPGTDRILTFGGQSTCTMEPGVSLISDPVDLDVAPFSDLAVSLYLPKDTGLPTNHPLGLHTAYISSGDVTGQPAMPNPTTTTAYLWLAGVDVAAPPDAFAIAAFGDSITDGFRTTLNADMTWPQLLARRLAASKRGSHIAVINEGFSGNEVLRDGAGVSALARLDRDVLSQPGVKWMILLEGINDINGRGRNPGPDALTCEDLIALYLQLIVRAYASGINVIGATIMPEEGVPTASERGEEIRQAANQWIRSKAFDAVIDFDAIVRDPARPARIRPELDPGDHIHPNDSGNQAMAAAFDLKLFEK